MIKNIFLLLSLFTVFTHAFAVPANLMFHGKPIDSLCFSANENASNVINLNQCGAEKEKYVIKGQNAELNKNGFIGYDWQDPNYSSAPQGYSYYRFFEAGDQKYWIYTVNSGGGSGEFTAIYLAQRKDTDTLVVEDIVGGDRCNSGVQDVSVKNDTMTFSVNLTPYDLVDLSKKKLARIKPYDDLAACAACCVAKSFYSIHVTSKAKFNFVDLGKVSNISELPEQGKYQTYCNKLFMSYIDKKETRLDQSKIDSFVESLNGMVLHNPSLHPS